VHESFSLSSGERAGVRAISCADCIVPAKGFSDRIFRLPLIYKDWISRQYGFQLGD
jgi:hypothetical protein